MISNIVKGLRGLEHVKEISHLDHQELEVIFFTREHLTNDSFEMFQDIVKSGADSFLIRKAPRKKVPLASTPPSEKSPTTEAVYLSNGKLNLPFLLGNAQLLFEASEFQLAKNIYKTILQSGECSSKAYFALARCLEAEKKFEEARANYENSIAHHSNLETYQALSSMLLKQDLNREAGDVLVRALSLKDISSQVQFELRLACANSFLRAGIFQDTEIHLQKALDLKPGDPSVLINLGVLSLEMKNINRAKRLFQEVLAKDPKQPKAYDGIGQCLLFEKDFKQAHAFLLKSLELDINNPRAIFQIVQCSYEMKSYATATRLLEEYLGVAPVNANLFYTLAGLQFQLGRLSEAKESIEKVLELDGDHSEAKDLRKKIEKYVS